MASFPFLQLRVGTNGIYLRLSALGHADVDISMEEVAASSANWLPVGSDICVTAVSQTEERQPDSVLLGRRSQLHS